MRKALIIFACLGGLLVSPLANAYPVKIRYEADLSEDIQDEISRRLPDEPDAQTALQARRQGRRARTLAMGILNAFGYYDPDIEISVIGEGDQARPELVIDPGAQFVVRRLEIAYEGVAPQEDDQEVAKEAISLQPGMPAIAAEVIDQERQIGSELRSLGYPYAEVTSRDVIGDRDAKTISVRYRVTSGPRVRFANMLYPDGLRTKERYLERLNPIETGSLYDPNSLALYNSRLAETRIFDRSVAKLSEEPVSIEEDGTELRNIELLLTERDRNTLTLGAGFDTAEGFGLNAEFLRRNLTRRGEILVATGLASQREYGLELVWRRPNQLGYGRGVNLFASAADENTDAFNQKSVAIGAGVEVIESPQFQYSVGTEGRYIRQSGESERRDFQTVSLTGSMSLDRSDSILDPRRGWRAEGRIKPTYAFSDAGDVSYLRAVGQARAYLPLSEDGRFVAAGRVRLGTLFGSAADDVPGEDRFFSGGGGSVRGYAFQAIGPFENDVPLGGRSLTEASLEGRARITDTIGAVAFIDAGNVSDAEYPRFDNLRLGAGVGVRYMTPAGPLRLDIATPLNPSDRDDAIQVYISIGQAF